MNESIINPDEIWDADRMGCGELVMILRIRLNNMRPGAVLKLIARDEGAQEDIPAWCRMTGQQLIAHDHPTYWIRRRGD